MCLNLNSILKNFRTWLGVRWTWIFKYFIAPPSINIFKYQLSVRCRPKTQHSFFFQNYKQRRLTSVQTIYISAILKGHIEGNNGMWKMENLASHRPFQKSMHFLDFSFPTKTLCLKRKIENGVDPYLLPVWTAAAISSPSFLLICKSIKHCYHI